MSESLSPGWPPRPIPDAAAHRRDQLAIARAGLSRVTDQLTDELTPEEVAIDVAGEMLAQVLDARVARGADVDAALDVMFARLQDRMLR